MKVNFYASYKTVAGCDSIDVPAPPDVLTLLKELGERWPGFRALVLNPEATDKNAYVAVLVSGKFTEQLDGMATKLTEEDVVTITPLIAGG